MFVAFEGIDGSGKTTQARLAAEFLKKSGRKVLLTNEPTKGYTGKLVRNLIREGSGSADDFTIQLLFMADRAEHIFKKLIPAIQERKEVICDRYILSTIAYGMASNLDEEILIKANKAFPMPDANIIIQIAPEISIQRIEERDKAKGKKKEERFEKLEFLRRVADNYIRLSKQYQKTYIVDGNKDKIEVSSDVQEILKKIV